MVDTDRHPHEFEPRNTPNRTSGEYMNLNSQDYTNQEIPKTKTETLLSEEKETQKSHITYKTTAVYKGSYRNTGQGYSPRIPIGATAKRVFSTTTALLEVTDRISISCCEDFAKVARRIKEFRDRVTSINANHIEQQKQQENVLLAKGAADNSIHFQFILPVTLEKANFFDKALPMTARIKRAQDVIELLETASQQKDFKAAKKYFAHRAGQLSCNYF